LDQEGSGDGMKLYYFGARYYDPEIGGWLSCDKAGQFWNKYGYAASPILYVDEDGNWFGIDDLLAACIGAVINVATHLGNIHNAGQFFGYLGLGAAQGDLSLYGPAGIVAGGVIAGAGNAALGGGSGRDILMGGAVGGIASYVGSIASSVTTPFLSKIPVDIGGYSSPLLEGAFKGAVGGAAGGFAGGFTGGLIASGGNLNTALQSGIGGAKSGAILGGIVGGSTRAVEAYNKGQNPFLNAPHTNLPSTIRLTQAGEKYTRYESGDPRFTKINDYGGLKPDTYAAPANEGIIPPNLRSDVYNLPNPQIPRPVVIPINPEPGIPIIGPRPVSGGTGNEVIFPFGY
jgi:hypothetical protein